MEDEKMEVLSPLEDISSKRKNSEKSSSKHKKIAKLDDKECSYNAQIGFENTCSNDTVDNVLEDMEEEIDYALEQTLYKSKLTPAKVKNILRHVIANEYVLAMVRNTMKPENSDDEQADSTYEPKLTRSKAKEMRKKPYKLPWPVSSPVKKAENVAQKFLKEELPDESSSDEDYKPNEEESHSDDDDVLATSPKTSDSVQLIETISSSSPVQTITESLSEEENICASEPFSFEIPPNASEADKIALRTRSKLCLNDTPLEDIEASFIAPDITIDMYDTNCDDEEWREFLRELCKPIDSQVILEHPEVDDIEDDPEYKVLEEEDIPDYNDLRYDSSVKITRDELNALMAEILEFTQQDLGDLDEDEDEENKTQLENDAPAILNVGPVSVKNVQSQWMNSDERLQLDEQMRMYVQILVQSYLLSHGNPQLNFINVSSKLLLDEIKMFASREMASNERSAFYAQNLDGALEIVNEYEDRKAPLRPRSFSKMKKFAPPSVPQHVKKTMATSKVFIYPELLPVCGFREIFEKQKTKFSAPEDNLIALGMEQFEDVENPVEYINALLVPTKTVEQIKFRIKNSKVKKNPLDNPIKFYHVYKQAPQFQRVIRIFDHLNVKAPEDYPLEVLPKWMESYSKVGIRTHISPVIAPKEDTKPPVAIVRPMFRKPLESRKLAPILPRGFSPLKHISPILKKYSQQRRVIPILPFSINSPQKRRYLSKQFAKPMIKPALNLNTSSKAKYHKEPVSKALLSTENKNINKDQSILKENKRNDDSSDMEVNSVHIESMSMEIEQMSSDPLCVSESHIETELLDEIDDEIGEEEQDMASTMAVTNNVNGKKQVVSKKRNKLQRDLEASLALLQPTLLRDDPKKEEREVLFANSYLLRASEILKNNPEVYEKFLSILCKYHQSTKSPIELYTELQEVLKEYPTLIRDFIIFLKPEQAKECGKYKEHIALSRIRDFFWKIEMHFKHQPQFITRILRTFAQLQQQVDITSSEVITALQPLLRNQSHLMEELFNLLPDVTPPEYLMTDFENVTVPISDDDNSSIDSCEDITIPDIPDPYGGKDCPCNCHNSSTDNRMLNKSRHCVKCGVKFIDGRIYIQTGKVLKPAQVTYHDLPSSPADKENVNGLPVAPKPQMTSETVLKSTHMPEINGKIDSCFVSSKKDVTKFNNIQRPILNHEENPTLSNNRLPCDVIEDTVFPAVTNTLNKSTPSDFSLLKDMIGPATAIESESKTSSSPQNLKWTRDEDRLIIYNCQIYGISRKAFSTSAATFKNRTAEEVEERFLNLMKMLSEEMKKQ